MIVIIGSGASGVAAASALIDRGVDKLMMLDVGEKLEPDRQQIVDRLPDLPQPQLDIEYEKLMNETVSGAGLDIPSKTIFGSSYPYKEPEGVPKIDTCNARVMRSFARGGLSNVWGGSALPYPPSEMCGWPITKDEMNSHYKAMMDMMHLTGRRPDFQNLFQDVGNNYGVPVIGPQAERLLEKLSGERNRLEEKGILCGVARSAYLNEDHHCRRCSKCLLGCPQDIIYSARHTLEELIRKGLKYQPEALVRRLLVRESSVGIEYKDLSNEKTIILDASRVFVAAGVWNTASLVLESVKAYAVPITVKHSDRFTLPMFQLGGVPCEYRVNTNTLSQVFIEIISSRICSKPVHLQIYGYNQFIDEKLTSFLDRANLRSPLLADALLSRLLVAYGYLHSDVSSSLVVSLKEGSPGQLSVLGNRSPKARRISRKVMWRLWKEFRVLQMAVGWPKVDIPGGGNHSGGCFPMRDQPGLMETNKWGELHSLDRVHLVDASVLPSISATTIQLTAMANAHRIASKCPL